MEVEIMSEESIKPSCPTPHDFRTYKLSILDQRKIKDGLYIDCNDSGVQMLRLSRLDSSNAGIPVVMIQVNILKCGGIAIGTQTSHKIFDGPTSTIFLKAWAASARGLGEEAPRPSFIAPQLFPQNNLLPRDTMLAIWPSVLKFGKCLTRRFVFNASSIATLKAKASSTSFVPNPTRVETIATAQCHAEANLEFQLLVALLRKSIMETSGKFVEQLQLTSMCKVGIYEADFGWGKPMWVSPGGINGLVFQNLAFLIDTRKGDGIEAWVTLDEKDMAILQSDTEILSFASLDPSPFEPQD
ncbi:hypothetical protein REPUB_Repub19eG0006100 [Reevesia pubescens]